MIIGINFIKLIIINLKFIFINSLLAILVIYIKIIIKPPIIIKKIIKDLQELNIKFNFIEIKIVKIISNKVKVIGLNLLNLEGIEIK